MRFELTPEARRHLTPLTRDALPKRRPKDEATAFAELRAAVARFGPRKRIGLGALAQP